MPTRKVSRGKQVYVADG